MHIYDSHNQYNYLKAVVLLIQNFLIFITKEGNLKRYIGNMQLFPFLTLISACSDIQIIFSKHAFSVHIP